MASEPLCPRIDKAMSLIGQRWTGLIIFQLLKGPQRFSEIQSVIPVSGRLLTERLKMLEQEGIVVRMVYPDTPVRIEYMLTEKGKALEGCIRALASWAEKWVE